MLGPRLWPIPVEYDTDLSVRWHMEQDIAERRRVEDIEFAEDHSVEVDALSNTVLQRVATGVKYELFKSVVDHYLRENVTAINFTLVDAECIDKKEKMWKRMFETMSNDYGNWGDGGGERHHVAPTLSRFRRRAARLPAGRGGCGGCGAVRPSD